MPSSVFLANSQQAVLPSRHTSDVSLNVDTEALPNILYMDLPT